MEFGRGSLGLDRFSVGGFADSVLDRNQAILGKGKERRPE